MTYKKPAFTTWQIDGRRLTKSFLFLSSIVARAIPRGPEFHKQITERTV